MRVCQTIGDTYTYPSVGSKFYLKKADSDTSDKFSKTGSDYYRFSMSGKIASYGNIQWLLDCTGRSLFCTDNCYHSLFYLCSSLTKSPELQDQTLADNCYNSMFYNCTHLSVTTDPSGKQGAYQILSVSSTTVSDWGAQMFTGTAGDYTGDAHTGVAYYCYGN